MTCEPEIGNITGVAAMVFAQLCEYAVFKMKTERTIEPAAWIAGNSLQDFIRIIFPFCLGFLEKACSRRGVANRSDTALRNTDQSVVLESPFCFAPLLAG